MPEPLGSLKKTWKTNIRNPYSKAYTEQQFNQSGAQINSCHVFQSKSNTFALVSCFLPSVLGETGVGAVSMSFLVLGPA